MKYLLVLVVVVVVAWMLLGRASGRARPRGGAARRTGANAEPMLACAHCGVHLPRGDAVMDGTLPYCSEAHRLSGPRGK